MMSESFTTGLPGLDQVLKGVMPGDNIVWQVDSVSDYRALVTPYAEAAQRAGQRLVYCLSMGGNETLAFRRHL